MVEYYAGNFVFIGEEMNKFLKLEFHVALDLTQVPLIFEYIVIHAHGVEM